MKKLFLLVTIYFFATAMLSAQEWIAVGDDNTPVRIQESLVTSSEEEIIVDVKVGGFFQNVVETQYGEQVVISGEDMASILIAGAPDLPMYPISMIVGNTAEMEVSVVKSSYVDLQNIEVAPSKGNFSRDINPEDVPYTYSAVYQQDAFYPAQQAVLEDPYILRDFRGQNLMVYPYAYNPVTKTLRVYTDMHISVKKVSDNGLNPKVVTKRSNVVSPEVNASYKRRFINYPANERYSFIEDEGEMLVICVDEYEDVVKSLVEWKNISGRPTTMALVSETGTLDDMKTYVENYYNTHPNLTFLLLVGEYSDLPPYEVSTYLDGIQYFACSDNYYGMLEGKDFYEEVLVGRLSVKNLEDARNQVDRIIYYERDIDETATWLSKGIGIAANQGGGHFDERESEHIDFIRDTLLNYTYTEISQRYDGVDSYKISATDIAEDINKGLGIATYCDHGEELKWVLADFDTQCVHNLTNDNMLPFIWSVSCLNGHFDVDECFAESWMRSINPETGAPTGAIGGMFSWISQPWVPPLCGQDEMVAILTEWRDGYSNTLGGASLNGNMYILDMCPEDRGYTHYSWLLFGDPSLMLRTKVPEKMNVTCNTSDLLLGMSSLTVNADVNYGIATLSKGGEVVASSYFSKGKAELNFPELTEEGMMKLVVLSYNKVTEVRDIEVKSASESYVIFNDYELNEADGQLDYAESINFDLKVKNIGVKEATNVEVELISKSDYVNITANKATVASLAVNEIVEINDIFKFTVADNVPDQEKLEFNVKCTAGEESWISEFSIKANAPHIVFESISVKETSVEPGSDATLCVVAKNIGNSEARNIVFDYACSSGLLLQEPSLATDVLLAGETLEITIPFEVEETVKNGSLYEVLCYVKVGTYKFSSNYFIVVGQSLEDFETGDFSKVDWQFEGGADWIISNNAYEGTYSARSGKIADNADDKTSSMFITVELVEEEKISFYHKRSCDYYAKLEFYVDGEKVSEWRGNNSTPTEWEKFSYSLTKGIHTLKWTYNKKKADPKADDCVFLDNIILPPLNIVNVMNPVTNLNAEEDYGTVTLTWDANENADSYIIERDGNHLAEQSETTFTERLTANGVYTYSVMAKKNASVSQPTTITVIVDELDIEEIDESNIDIYPNPASDVVYVNLTEPFNVTIYNYQGQLVKNVYVDNAQVNVSGLSDGIYFMLIKTENNVAVKKIIVE